MLELLNHGWLPYARPFVAPPPPFFFLCWSLPIQQYSTALQQCCGYRSAVVVQNLQGSSRFTFLVLYRWLWFPITTGTNGSRLWFSHYRGWSMDGSLEHGWFRRNSVCCGPVYGPWLSLRFGYGAVYNSRLSLRGGFGPVCIQHRSSRTATSPMPSTLGMHLPLRTNSSMFLHPPSPQQPPLVPIAHPGGIGCVFLAAQQ